MTTYPLIELHYLPTLEYMALLLHHGGAELETHEHFQRRTFRNRTHILTDKGVLALSLPLEGGNKGGMKQGIQEIRIDAGSRGPQKHWRALETAYASAPFFEHYAPFLEPIFNRPPDTLFEFSYQLLTKCLELMQIGINLTFSKDFVHTVPSDQPDARDTLTPRASFEHRPWYRPVPYYQVFGGTFVPNLSVLDLLFTNGPQSSQILAQSVEKGR